MKRRNFLQTAAAFSIPALVPITGVRANSSRFTSLIEPESDRILVIIHLFGGNDGLNTVIPIDRYDDLLNVRRSVAIEEKRVLKLTDTLGLHPEMKDMKNLFSDGRLGIVQSVGYPNQNRSHFRSTDIYTSGSAADEFLTSGWMGRYLETQYAGYPAGYPSSAEPHPPAVSIGDVAHPTCEGTKINFSQTVLDPNNTRTLAMMNGMSPDDKYGEELAFIRTTIRQTNSYNDVIKDAADRGRNAVTYRYRDESLWPKNSSNPLAEQLKKVARMISGGLRSKVYTVYMDGFDLHASQVVENNTHMGTHAQLLSDVSRAIGDFQNDLKAQGLDERVLGLTFSEFGRRIRPNASFGTDHGSAAPMFLFGSCIQSQVSGDNVDLNGDISQGDGVSMQFDFRDVYGSILVDWFNVRTSQVKNLLHDGFKYLPLTNKCNEDDVVNTDDTSTEDGWTIGQPFQSGDGKEISISVDSPGSNRLRYSLFDGRGRLVLANEIGVEGKADHKLFTRPSRLPSGTYVLRLATDSGAALTREVQFN
ncbi:uncharacterized protein (DUF1501 family) [Lewinella aquimaris]|uniref:Uncharacterized protein (DUF1501 family) n=1 Tax=Neolewinella aquimaris TaxID=1835722 RepID=A0A840E4Z3_9BACT|nr:DUF1501 domain-containing protein [Neolewinella aquimaris]MBB4079013.1 uncharacterized protein (DUF1501 family) [Neolewinella aquimaris]